MNRAAIYCRVSSDRQREKSTIQSQKDILPKLALDNGYRIVETYVDDGISGETIEDRPAFMRLLADAEEAHFDAVFVIDYDRLSRASDLAQFSWIKSVFKRNRILVITPFQRYDFANEEDDFISDLMGILAKREKQKIIARTKRGRIAKWRRGLHAHGIVPFGYRWTGTAYEIVSEEARIVRLIYDLALKGLGSELIVKELEVQGKPTPTDLRPYRRHRLQSGWAETTVRRILTQSTYVGDLFVGVREKDGGRVIRKPRSEWILIKIPPIVTRDEYEKARQLAARNKTFSGNYKHEYLLSHLMKCGECGTSLVAEDSHGKGFYICYRRRKKTCKGPCDLPWQPQGVIEKAVWTAIVRLVDEPEFLKAEIRSDFESRIREANTGFDRETLEKMLQTKQVERERVLTLFRRGRIASSDIDREFGKIEGEEAILRRNMDLIDNREKIERSLTRNLDQIDAKLTQIRSRLHHLNFTEKQRLLEVMTWDGHPGITVHKNGEIELRGLFNFEHADKLLEKMDVIAVA